MVEFDILMQCYSKLCDQMRLIDFNEFFDELHFYGDTFMFYGCSISKPEFLLTILASQLLSGIKESFFKMLKTLKRHEDDSTHSITVEIQVALHQRLIGM